MIVADCFWTLLDKKLVDSINLNLGAVSGVDDPVQEVNIGEIWNPEHVTLPFCLIRSQDLAYAPEAEFPHGDGLAHIDDMAYAYDIFFFLTDEDELLARQRIQFLTEEARNTLRQEWMLWGFQANSGEYLRRVVPLNVELQVRGMGGHGGEYMGSSMLSLLFYTAI